MTRPRSQLISLEDTPYYHCVSRCVRRAFLCGDDIYSGKNFNHRKPWVLERLKLMGDVFAIDIAAYAIMSNHYHVVLHVNKALNQSWNRDTIIERWLRLYKGPSLVHRYLQGQLQSDAEYWQLNEIVETWRSRLCSISWFMACLNEYIARKANQEDSCQGRFWEGRFKSQALLDEPALLSCMAYVDLNPVRAGISKDLDSSDFTSIQTRIRQVTKSRIKNKNPSPRLMPFRARHNRNTTTSTLPYTLKNYLELTNWTGQRIRKDKKGFISTKSPALLATINLTETQWQILVMDIQKQAISIFNGLDKLAAQEKRLANKAA